PEPQGPGLFLGSFLGPPPSVRWAGQLGVSAQRARADPSPARRKNSARAPELALWEPTQKTRKAMTRIRAQLASALGSIQKASQWWPSRSWKLATYMKP